MDRGRIIKRAGRVLLGVFFWFQIVRIALEVPLFTLLFVHWQFPEWELGGFSTACSITEFDVLGLIVNALLWLATAIIGWFYVFPRRLAVLWVFLVAWGCVFFVLLVPGIGRAQVPDDAALIGRFEEHKVDFDRLAVMLVEDKHLAGVTPERILLPDNYDWPRPESEWGITKERWNEYRALFDKLGLQHGWWRIDGRDFEAASMVVAADRELAGCEVGKGYAYSPNELPRQVVSLDSLPDRSGIAFRKIGDGWYLIYQSHNY